MTESKTKKILMGLGVVFVLALVSLVLQFSTPNIADPDAFYHMAHAKVYAERGVFYSEFPWAQFSIIKDLKSDIWYGFHLFLIPFTYIKNAGISIKLAGAFITFLTLIGFYFALNRLKIKWPILWALVFVLATPDVMYRLIMTRPHNLSFALTIVTFSLFLTSSKKWPLILLGFTAAFLHSALSWLPLAVVIIASLVSKFRREPIRWRSLLYLALGLVAGLIARPNPLAGLKLVYIQVIQIIFVKTQNIPLTFGRELKTPNFDSIIKNILPVILIGLIGIVLYKIAIKKYRASEIGNYKNIFVSALTVSAFFLLITLFVARRSYDIFTGFTLITSSMALTLYLNKISNTKHKNTVVSVLIISIGILSLNSVPLFKKYNNDAWSPNDLKESSLWLKENAKPGEIVFNTSWDQFGSLMYWNPQNYYINGMDPIFQYAFSPTLYWKNHFILADAGYTNTCGLIRCKEEEIETTPSVLVNDFKASYVVLKKSRNPKTYFYWLKDKTFPLVFENSVEAVFKISPSNQK
ncbi:MAG: hypothetical protein Q8Q95_04210 [bacterium]|nr:hypothetical protein [bacterium]